MFFVFRLSLAAIMATQHSSLVRLYLSNYPTIASSTLRCQYANLYVAKTRGIYLKKLYWINKWPRNHLYVSITFTYRRWERRARRWVPRTIFKCNPWPHPHYWSLCHVRLGLPCHGTWERVNGQASLHSVQGLSLAINWLLQIVEYERAREMRWGCGKKKGDQLLGVKNPWWPSYLCPNTWFLFSTAKSG